MAYKMKIPFVKLLTHQGQKKPSLLIRKKTKKEVTKEITYSEFEQFIEKTKMWIQRIEGLHYIVKSFLKKVTTDQVRWQTTFGLRDAALTGIAGGSFWTMKASLIGLIGQLTKMKSPPTIDVLPVFGQSVWQTEFSCIISFRPGHAIVAFIQLMFHWRGKKYKWKSTAETNKQM